MTSNSIDWTPVPLSSEEQEVVNAYRDIGVPLDALVYTPKFKELAKLLKRDPDDEAELRWIYRHLMTLRKRGRLPRIYRAD